MSVLMQVILVGYSYGGASVSYALEHCPKKISKDVFLTATMVKDGQRATMVKDGQRPFDVFSEEVCTPFMHLLCTCMFLLDSNSR